MLNHLIKTHARRLFHRKSFSLINILGLSIGLAACLLLYLYVRNELSYDAYNEKAPRIARVTSLLHSPESDLVVAGSPAALAAVLVQECPEIETAVRIEPAAITIRQGTEMVAAKNFRYSEPAIFTVFSFSFLEGSAATALNLPHSMVLTRSAARHYLGPGPAIGRTIVANRENYRVTAVIEDRPANTDLPIDALLSKDFSKAGWADFDVDEYTFLLFRGKPDIQRFNKRLSGVTSKYTQPELDRQGIKEYRFNFEAERLADVHFSKGKLEDTPKGNRQFLAIFSMLAIFILVIALLNYINLSTARAVERAKEVAVRKVIGAAPGRLIRQFLAESSILVALAWVLAFGLALAAIPVFNRLLSTQLSLGWETMIFPALLFPVTTLLAGGYPALVLSRFSPLRTLRSTPERETKGIGLRKLLTVIQFVIALVMLAGTAVIYEQMQYIEHKDLGVLRTNIACINIPPDSIVRAQAPAFIGALRHESGVRAISVGSGLPAEGVQMATTTGYTAGKQRILMVNYFFIDPQLLSMLHIQLAAGRNFSDSLATDRQGGFIVNQAFVRTMGWKSGLGESLEGSGIKGKVVGVVRDFFYKSLHSAIEPLVMVYKIDPPLAVLLRTAPQELPRLKLLWKRYFPSVPFDYYFMDENFNAQYAKDRMTMLLFNTFTGLVIFICFIGLYGLVSLITIQRTKEIGIRKVLGASLAQLLILLTRDMGLLVGIAACIALPLAGIAGSRWLASYAYHISLSLWVFLWPLVLLLALTFLIAGSRILRAALANPVDSLRSE